jgi:AmmeMemoRadiSam system protein B/AmmeMemoRadiSam system protein A
MFIFLSMGISGEKNTRGYLTTGPWYPETREKLNTLLNHCFAEAKEKDVQGKIVGIIAPHAGIVYSGKCAAAAYKSLGNSLAKNNIDTVIILGVSHRGGFYGASVSNFDYNSTPLGKIEVDKKITSKLSKETLFQVNNQVMQNEHSIEVHLPFLQKVFNKRKYKIVPILLGVLNKKDFKTIATIIKKYIDSKSLIIASTDFTHYGRSFSYTPFTDNIKSNLTKLDKGMINQILRLDLDGYFNYMQKTKITMCGFSPVGVLIETFSDKRYQSILTDYYKSGDMNNNYSHSVSYASFIIVEGGNTPMKNPTNLTQQEREELLLIARKTLEEYFSTGQPIKDIEKKHKISQSMKEITGVFVTLKKKGHLRGCIGSIIGKAPLFEGVQNNAMNAAVRDYRFKPLKKEELKEVDIEISVMTPLQKIENYKKIKLGVDGVIIRKGPNQAVFLPQVATETGWNLDQFLSRLCQKAGLTPQSYLSSETNSMEFYIFQAQVFGEK